MSVRTVLMVLFFGPPKAELLSAKAPPEVTAEGMRATIRPAQSRLQKAHVGFTDAVAGVVAENEKLRNRTDASPYH